MQSSGSMLLAPRDLSLHRVRVDLRYPRFLARWGLVVLGRTGELALWSTVLPQIKDSRRPTTRQAPDLPSLALALDLFKRSCSPAQPNQAPAGRAPFWDDWPAKGLQFIGRTILNRLSRIDKVATGTQRRLHRLKQHVVLRQDVDRVRQATAQGGPHMS